MKNYNYVKRIWYYDTMVTGIMYEEGEGETIVIAWRKKYYNYEKHSSPNIFRSDLLFVGMQ